MFHPKVPYAGVTWEQSEQKVACSVRTLVVCKRNFRLKPKDHSEAELERSFQVAVAWKKRQEEERREDGEVQAKAPEEAAQVQQPEVLSCKYPKAVKNPAFSNFSLHEFHKCFKHARSSHHKKGKLAASHPYQQT